MARQGRKKNWKKKPSRNPKLVVQSAPGYPSEGGHDTVEAVSPVSSRVSYLGLLKWILLEMFFWLYEVLD